MKNTALLLVDYQNDYFPEGKWELEGIDLAAANGAMLLERFRHKNLPVVHIRHEFESHDAPFFVAGSDGAKIHTSVAAQEGEPVILKHSANSFKDTDLKSLLDELEIQRVIVIGAMSHMCIDAATRAAADYGYEVIVAQDACATVEQTFNGVTVPAKQVHASFMSALGFAYAEVLDTATLLERL